MPCKSSGRAFCTDGAVDDLVPLAARRGPAGQRRLDAKVYWGMQTSAGAAWCSKPGRLRRGPVRTSRAKAANLPLDKLLGGAASDRSCTVSDTAWLWMSAPADRRSVEPEPDQGMMGIKVEVEATRANVRQLRRRSLGLGRGRLAGRGRQRADDFATALAMAFLRGEIGADWFEEPITCEDVEGHARLASRLEVPLAAGEMLFDRSEFVTYLQRAGAGGAAAGRHAPGRHHRLAEDRRTGRAAPPAHLAPHLLPEIGIHLAAACRA